MAGVLLFTITIYEIALIEIEIFKKVERVGVMPFENIWVVHTLVIEWD